MIPSALVLVASLEFTSLVALLVWAASGEDAGQRPLARAGAFLSLAQAALLVVVFVLCALESRGLAACAAVLVCAAVLLGADALLLRRLVAAGRSRAKDASAEYVEAQARRMRADLARLEREQVSVDAFRDEVVSGLASARAMVLDGESPDAVARHLSEVAGILDDSARIVCAHPALNALLQIKNRRCEELGISFMVAVEVPPDVGLPSTDLCGIFFNLIDNAVNGCKGLARGRRFVHVQARVERGFLLVKVLNSYAVPESPETSARARVRQARDGVTDPDENPIQILEEETAPAESEASALEAAFAGIEEPEALLREHGWGLQIVEGIVRRHGGLFSAEPRGGIFEATATIPLT